ncbi:iron chaperone [Aeromicrobium sp.]|uniref:iron chaperone n=1 Tax=Aeromicrobium sp. TaxID=1871063 RepID=UPI002FC9985E
MTDDKQKFTTVDEYLEAATYDVEPRLIETRRVIRAALPDAEETISYNIPAYKQDGVVVIQFAGYTEHTSLTFFPTAATFAHFAEELAPYRTSKSAIQFPLTEPLPVDLIDAITRFRAEEAAAYAARKQAGR